MTRLRYTKDGRCLRTNRILINDDLYRGCIIIESNEYIITDSYGYVAAKGKAATMLGAKYAIRSHFKNMGAKFFDEVRRRK